MHAWKVHLGENHDISEPRGPAIYNLKIETRTKFRDCDPDRFRFEYFEYLEDYQYDGLNIWRVFVQLRDPRVKAETNLPHRVCRCVG
jgi:hypothetical protein